MEDFDDFESQLDMDFVDDITESQMPPLLHHDDSSTSTPVHRSIVHDPSTVSAMSKAKLSPLPHLTSTARALHPKPYLSRLITTFPPTNMIRLPGAPPPPMPPRPPRNTLAADRAAPRTALASLTPISTFHPIPLTINIDFPATTTPIPYTSLTTPSPPPHILPPTVRPPSRTLRASQKLELKNIENIHPFTLPQLAPAIAAAHAKTILKASRAHKAANPTPEALLKTNLGAIGSYGRGGEGARVEDDPASYGPRAMRIELERLFWKIQGTVFKVKDRTMQREAMDARQELFVVLEGFERSGRPELRLGEEKRKRIRDEVAKAKGFEGFMMEDMASQRNRDGFNEAEEDLVVTEVGDMGFNTGWAAWYVEMLVKLGEEVEEKGRRGLMSEETVARQRRAVERERRRVIIEWDLWNQRMEARARGEMEGILRYNTDVVWRKEGEVWVASDGTRIEEASMRQFGAYIFGDEDAGVAVATQALRMGTGAAQRQARGATQGQVRPRGGAQSQGRARNTRQAQQRQRPPAPDDGDTPMGGA